MNEDFEKAMVALVEKRTVLLSRSYAANIHGGADDEGVAWSGDTAHTRGERALVIYDAKGHEIGHSGVDRAHADKLRAAGAIDDPHGEEWRKRENAERNTGDLIAEVMDHGRQGG